MLLKFPLGDCVRLANTDGSPTAEVTEEGAGVKAGRPERFFESTFNAFAREFSPDGRWIAYATAESHKIGRLYCRVSGKLLRLPASARSSR
jgi:hypothetical protein